MLEITVALIDKDYVKTKELLKKVDYNIKVLTGEIYFIDLRERPEITPLLHYSIYYYTLRDVWCRNITLYSIF